MLSNSFEHQLKHDDISEACNKNDKKKKTNLGWSVITSIRIRFFSLFLEVDATVCHVFLCDICVKVGIQLKTEIFKNKIFSHLNFSGHPIWATCRQQISPLLMRIWPPTLTPNGSFQWTSQWCWSPKEMHKVRRSAVRPGPYFLRIRLSGMPNSNAL